MLLKPLESHTKEISTEYFKSGHERFLHVISNGLKIAIHLVLLTSLLSKLESKTDAIGIRVLEKYREIKEGSSKSLNCFLSKNV
jgi:hypothetical protein